MQICFTLSLPVLRIRFPICICAQAKKEYTFVSVINVFAALASGVVAKCHILELPNVLNVLHVSSLKTQTALSYDQLQILLPFSYCLALHAAGVCASAQQGAAGVLYPSTLSEHVQLASLRSSKVRHICRVGAGVGGAGVGAGVSVSSATSYPFALTMMAASITHARSMCSSAVDFSSYTSRELSRRRPGAARGRSTSQSRSRA